MAGVPVEVHIKGQDPSQATPKLNGNTIVMSGNDGKVVFAGLTVSEGGASGEYALVFECPKGSPHALEPMSLPFMYSDGKKKWKIPVHFQKETTDVVSF